MFTNLPLPHTHTCTHTHMNDLTHASIQTHTHTYIIHMHFYFIILGAFNQMLIHKNTETNQQNVPHTHIHTHRDKKNPFTHSPYPTSKTSPTHTDSDVSRSLTHFIHGHRILSYHTQGGVIPPVERKQTQHSAWNSGSQSTILGLEVSCPQTMSMDHQKYSNCKQSAILHVYLCNSIVGRTELMNIT